MSKIQSSVSKSFKTTEAIARYFIALDCDSRIKTVTEFQVDFPVSRGTIQNALEILKKSKAVTLKSRGQLGTFLVEKNMDLLIELSELRFLMGVMPLPYSRLYEGLSTGMIYQFEQHLKIPLTMAYMRGAAQRITQVLNGRYDFAVVSRFAAKHHLKNAEVPIKIVFDFGPRSYLDSHVLLFADKKHSQIENGMRIGIDLDSIDQAQLTIEACKGKDVRFVHVEYTQLTRMLMEKEIDATVWNGDEIRHRGNFLHSVSIHDYNEDNTSAVLIVDERRTELENILKMALDSEGVISIQKEVVDGKRIPRY